MAFERLVGGLQNVPPMVLQAQMAAYAEQNRRRNAALQGGQMLSDTLLKGLGLYGDIKAGEAEAEYKQDVLEVQRGNAETSRMRAVAEVKAMAAREELDKATADRILAFLEPEKENLQARTAGERARTEATQQKTAEQAETAGDRKALLSGQVKEQELNLKVLEANETKLRQQTALLSEQTMALAQQREGGGGDPDAALDSLTQALGVPRQWIMHYDNLIQAKQRELLDRFDKDQIEQVMQTPEGKAAVERFKKEKAGWEAERMKWEQVRDAIARNPAQAGVHLMQALQMSVGGTIPQSMMQGPQPLPDAVRSQLEGLDAQGLLQEAKELSGG